MAEKLVIIGSGPAGWTAAIYAARANLSPLVFEGALHPLGQLNGTTEVENFPSWPAADSAAFGTYARSVFKVDGDADGSADADRRERYSSHLAFRYAGRRAPTGRRSIYGPELMEFMRQQALDCGARIETDDVPEVELGSRPFVLRSSRGRTVAATSLIIATGATANYLGLPSEERFKNIGVSACAVCDGALPRFSGKPLIVVGGGDSAAEEASYLSKFASGVTMLVRRDKLRASQAMQDRVRSIPKIALKWHAEVDEVLGDDERGVTGVRIKNALTGKPTETIPAAGMFLGIGHTPNTAFLRGQVKLDAQGFIQLTDPSRTTTSVEGVFAAGDVADPLYRQAVTAAGTGCKAALDAERWLSEQGIH